MATGGSSYSTSTGATGDTSQAPPPPASLATWQIPTAAATPGPMTLEKLATELGVKGKGADLENGVLEALAHRFDITTERVFTEKGAPQEQLPPGRAGGQGPRVNKAKPSPETMTQQITTPAQIVSEMQALTGVHLVGDVNGNPRAFLHDPQALAELATKLGSQAPTGLDPPPGLTGEQAYLSFVKKLSSTTLGNYGGPGAPKETFKQAAINYLAAGNYLSTSADQGTPDIATIASAYGKLLTDAQSGNTTVNAAYAANEAADVTPGGGAPSKPVSELVANIQGMGEKLGVYLNPQDITDISNRLEPDLASQGGVSAVQDELKNMVIQYFNPNDPRNPDGAAKDMYQKILATATAYGIPVASADITTWVMNGIKNTAGDSYSIAQAATDVAAAAATHYQTLAEGLYPTLAKQIQSGQQVSDLISPYNSITSQYTGIPSTTLADPGATPGGPTGKYYAFLQGASDLQTGNPTMMTMDAWRKELMQNPTYGFQNTQGAKDMASQLSAAILNEFGRVNTMGGTSTPVQSALPNSGFQGDLTANTSSG